MVRKLELVCAVCNKTFVTNQPHQTSCSKECRNEFKRLANKRWREANKENLVIYRETNRERMREYHKEHYNIHKHTKNKRTKQRRLKNPEHLRAISKKSYEKYKKSKFKQFYDKKKRDPLLKLSCLLRDRIKLFIFSVISSIFLVTTSSFTNTKGFPVSDILKTKSL